MCKQMQWIFIGLLDYLKFQQQFGKDTTKKVLILQKNMLML